jgi:hypothetical protein
VLLSVSSINRVGPFLSITVGHFSVVIRKRSFFLLTLLPKEAIAIQDTVVPAVMGIQAMEARPVTAIQVIIVPVVIATQVIKGPPVIAIQQAEVPAATAIQATEAPAATAMGSLQTMGNIRTNLLPSNGPLMAGSRETLQPVRAL